MAVSVPSARLSGRPACQMATEPVDGMDHSPPIHPDHGSSKPMEYWEDLVRQRRPRKRTPRPPAKDQPHDDGSHQIDDFA